VIIDDVFEDVEPVDGSIVEAGDLRAEEEDDAEKLKGVLEGSEMFG
jgi:hypothetical protein